MNFKSFAVRMPDLGVDLTADSLKISSDAIRRIPISTMIAQIVKLLGQVNKLEQAFYIHGDIRQPNVMIQPETGIMTIIDFDMLDKAGTFIMNYAKHFPFYSNPFEVNVLCNPVNALNETYVASLNKYEHIRDYATIKYGANLSKTNLSQTNLSQTNLSQTNLSQTNLSQTNLSQTNLSQQTLKIY